MQARNVSDRASIESSIELLTPESIEVVEKKERSVHPRNGSDRVDDKIS